MTIVVRCKCGKSLKVPDEGAGKKVRCPACQERVEVPSPELSLMPASDPLSGGAAVCPACGGALVPGAVLCVGCGHDLRTGRRAGAGEAAPKEARPTRRYPQTGLTLVYWGSRAGFGMITASLGLGLFVLGFWLADQPGAQTSDMALFMFLGFIIAAIGVQVGAKGPRLDWFQADEDDLSFEELVLARGAPTLSGLIVVCVWATGRLDLLFLVLLPLGLVGSTFAIVVGLILCFVMSSGGAQKLLAVGSGLCYMAAAALILLTPFVGLLGGLGVMSAAMGEVLFLLWLREMGRQLDFDAAVAHVMRLLMFVAIGGVAVALLALLLSSSLQAAMAFPPVFSIGAFSFYLIAVLYGAAATIWRLKIMRALLDELEVVPEGSTL